MAVETKPAQVTPEAGANAATEAKTEGAATTTTPPAGTAPVVAGAKTEGTETKTEPAKTELKADGTGSGEPEKAVPEAKDVELKLPEGVQVDEAFLAKAKETWKATGLTAEQQQATLDLYASHVAAQDKLIEEQAKQQSEKWRSELKADPDLGGAKLDESLAVAAKALDRFFGEDVRKLLDLSGLGNHPALARGLVKIGRQISEDTIAGTGGTVAPDPAKAALLSRYNHPTSRPGGK